MSLKLYLLRHGETAYSKTGGYCGELDTELTTEGIQMAKQFAEAYSTLPWVAVRIILCSLLGIDLGRYRDQIDAPAGSVSVVRFDAHGPLLQVVGERGYMDEHLRSLPGT
jgi:broad specificity phosphatase PhoE